MFFFLTTAATATAETAETGSSADGKEEKQRKKERRKSRNFADAEEEQFVSQKSESGKTMIKTKLRGNSRCIGKTAILHRQREDPLNTNLKLIILGKF